MSFNRKTYTLNDVCLKITDGAHQSPKSVDVGMPMCSVKDLTEFGLTLETARQISEGDYQKLVRQGCMPSVGDVLIAKDGNSALDTACSIATEVETVLLSSVAILRPNPELLDSDYLKYWFKSKRTINYLKSNFISGAAIPRVVLKDFKKAEITLPPLDQQRSASQILRALDNRIQLNHQVNQTLEQIAQTIFKSWFVDFEPVKAKIAALKTGGSEEDALLAAMQAISGKGDAELTRFQAEQPEQYAELRATAELFPAAMQDSELEEIPEGWGVDQLSELIQFNPRRPLKKGTLAPYLDMKNVPTSGHLAEDVVLREMNSGTKFVNGDTLLARITPCLENGKTAYVDFLDSDQVGWGSTEYIVMRSQEPYPESISYFIARDSNFRQHAIQSMTGTSGRQRANAKALAELPWIIYPKPLAEAFDRIAAPYLKLAKSHGNESKSLSAIRDALLPKLLSGEISVSNADGHRVEEMEPANV